MSSTPLPPLYDAWMRPHLAIDIPPETEATCDDCAMCAPGALPAGATATYFHSGAKCCTYFPSLPNFLVGRILGDDTAGARAVVRRLVTEARHATPLGLFPPPDYLRAYAAGKQSGRFGRDPDLICPYYQADDGSCGIWRHRNAICSTWFCKHVRGATAKRFWDRLATVLTLVETGLARWCVAELDVGAGALDRLFPGVSILTEPSGSGTADPAMWGAWAGREVDFYRACAERIGALTWRDVLQILGPELRIADSVLAARAAELQSTALPDRVELGPFVVRAITDEDVRIETYSPFDALDMPRPLLDALPLLTDGSLDQARAAVAQELDLDLEPELILQLLDFEVLRAR